MIKGYTKLVLPTGQFTGCPRTKHWVSQNKTIRDEPNDDFALLVEPPDPRAGEKREDISEKLISKIEGDGRIACWRLG
jgi:hypothetical protein